MKPSKPTATSTATSAPPEPRLPLAELQRRIAAAVMRPLADDDRMQTRWSDGRPTADVVGALIRPNDRLTAFERLEIYNRQYWFRLLDCLHDDYPGLRAVLGQRRFHALATAYLDRHPSRSPLLRDLGRDLATFVREQPAWTHPHTRLASDMARLEWAQIVAFDAASRRSPGLEKLAGTPPDRIHLRLQPYATLLALSFPVDAVVLRILRQDSRLRSEASNAVESFSRPRRNSIASRIARQPVRLLVHRVENAVYFKRLGRAPFLLLRALDSGVSLADALNGLAASRCRVTAGNVRDWFENWSRLGLLAG